MDNIRIFLTEVIKASRYLPIIVSVTFLLTAQPVLADNFNLDSSFNTGTFRFEMDNDAVWDRDSNFSSGLSLQYHTIRYSTWDETDAFGFMKWVGNHFPTLKDDESVVRYGHSIAQNIINPEDEENPNPPPEDLPYAGTLTYSMNWQRINSQTASVLQVTAGVLGEESQGEEIQRISHTNFGLGEKANGWDTQRDTEPILNIGYAYFWNLASSGDFTNTWGSQLTASPSFQLGNLSTSMDFGLALRYGWNMQEGFNSFSEPPGVGIFMDTLLNKPQNASPHGFELILAVKASALAYSVLYDGSFITADDRDVDHENFIVTGKIGLNYHYYKYMSIQLALIMKTDILDEDSLPPPPSGQG